MPQESIDVILQGLADRAFGGLDRLVTTHLFMSCVPL
jgi:hypothetical protein